MKGIIKSIMQLAVIWLICFGLLGLQPAWAATNISSTYKHAWSENVGWQNWNSTNAQATVGTTYLVGYAWAENIGWIKLGSTPEGVTYPNTTSTNWGVNRNSSGELSGYAWSENVGWINFNPTNSQVVIDTGDGKFSGYAWGENVGWIHFQNADPVYYVQKDAPLVVDLVSFTAEALEDRVLLEWETASEIDNAGFHLWRTDTENAEYVMITNSLISAEGYPTQGAIYSYEDLYVEPDLTYYYQLEDIDYNGVSTFHGPVSATLGDEAEAIVLIYPEDGALIPLYLPATFNWNSAGLERFKLGFSTSPDFKGKVIMLPQGSKRNGRWITGESYTPNRREWQNIRRLGRRGGTVYWAVFGEDEAGKSVTSEVFGLKIGAPFKSPKGFHNSRN